MPAAVAVERIARTYLVSFLVVDATGCCNEAEVGFAVACAVELGLEKRQEAERFRASGLQVSEVSAC